MPIVAKPGPTDRPTEFATAICHLVNAKCQKNNNFFLTASKERHQNIKRNRFSPPQHPALYAKV